MEEDKQLVRDKDPAGVPALCEALKNDVTTTKLDLTRLRIGDEEVAALAGGRYQAQVLVRYEHSYRYRCGALRT